MLDYRSEVPYIPCNRLGWFHHFLLTFFSQNQILWPKHPETSCENRWKIWKFSTSGYIIGFTQPMDPEKNSLNCIFPTKYGIPKSSKPVSHWLSKWWFGIRIGVPLRIPESLSGIQSSNLSICGCLCCTNKNKSSSMWPNYNISPT